MAFVRPLRAEEITMQIVAVIRNAPTYAVQVALTRRSSQWRSDMIDLGRVTEETMGLHCGADEAGGQKVDDWYFTQPIPHC
jgi:hypothetical protein